LCVAGTDQIADDDQPGGDTDAGLQGGLCIEPPNAFGQS
jgi:hypothetical protein